MWSVVRYQSLGTMLKDCLKNKTYTEDWIARIEAWGMAQGRCQVRTGKHCKSITE